MLTCIKCFELNLVILLVEDCHELEGGLLFKIYLIIFFNILLLIGKFLLDYAF